MVREIESMTTLAFWRLLGAALHGLGNLAEAAAQLAREALTNPMVLDQS